MASLASSRLLATERRYESLSSNTFVALNNGAQSGTRMAFRSEFGACNLLCVVREMVLMMSCRTLPGNSVKCAVHKELHSQTIEFRCRSDVHARWLPSRTIFSCLRHPSAGIAQMSICVSVECPSRARCTMERCQITVSSEWLIVKRSSRVRRDPHRSSLCRLLLSSALARVEYH